MYKELYYITYILFTNNTYVVHYLLLAMYNINAILTETKKVTFYVIEESETSFHCIESY